MKVENLVAPNTRSRGIVLVLISAVLWGISGTAAQYLFQHQRFTAEWLVVFRLLVSGLILLSFAYKKEKQKVWAIWKDKKDRVSIVIFGIIGMLACQYTYFAAIQHGNAATATVLQYVAPVMVTCFLAFRAKRLPSFKEVISVFLAVLGTFFLVTHGRFDSLSISNEAFLWGIASAFALAFYTLQPHKLLANWGSTIVVGWGMLIGGIGFSFVHPPWLLEGNWSMTTFYIILFVVIFGTVIPFLCYLDSLKYITASETSLLATVEPLSAVLFSVILLNVSFGFADWFGTLCILSTIAILSIVREKDMARVK